MSIQNENFCTNFFTFHRAVSLCLPSWKNVDFINLDWRRQLRDYFHCSFSKWSFLISWFFLTYSTSTGFDGSTTICSHSKR